MHPSSLFNHRVRDGTHTRGRPECLVVGTHVLFNITLEHARCGVPVPDWAGYVFLDAPGFLRDSQNRDRSGYPHQLILESLPLLLVGNRLGSEIGNVFVRGDMSKLDQFQRH